MGTMANDLQVAQTLGIARATKMAYVAGVALGEGEGIEFAIEHARYENEDEFGPCDENTVEGKFFMGIESSVETFVRMCQDKEA